jgi:heat shock protein HtpX
MWSRGGSRGNQIAIGIAAFFLYFLTNLLVMYASRIREYYADRGSVQLGNSPHHLATALYKLVYGSASVPKESLKQMEGYKAFFLNDPSRARREISDLKQVDTDMSGTIDQNELMAIRTKSVSVSRGDKMMELMSTHPNMVKRIKHLSTLRP